MLCLAPNLLTGETIMIRSDGRILTTHAGSLPRRERLVAMLVKTSRGEEVDGVAMAAEVSRSVVSACLLGPFSSNSRCRTMSNGTTITRLFRELSTRAKASVPACGDMVVRR